MEINRTIGVENYAEFEAQISFRPAMESRQSACLYIHELNKDCFFADVSRTARNFINTALHIATQRTQRFIRWVRVWIYKQAPWRDSITRLEEVWGGIYS